MEKKMEKGKQWKKKEEEKKKELYRDDKLRKMNKYPRWCHENSNNKANLRVKINNRANKWRNNKKLGSVKDFIMIVILINLIW